MIYFLYLHTFLIHAHSRLIKICGPLPLMITFAHDHSTKKIRVLIYIFISFVHDHSTKIRSHSYSLIYSFMNCGYISYATFIAVLMCFVHYIQGKLLLYFVRYFHGYMKSKPFISREKQVFLVGFSFTISRFSRI